VVRHFRATLELAGDDPAVLFWLGRALSLAHGEGEEELQRSVAAFLAEGDRAGAAEAEAELALFHRRRGSGSAAMEHIERALDLLAGGPPSRSRGAVLAVAGRLYVLGGRGQEGLLLSEEAAQIAAALSLDDIRAGALNSVALAKSMLGLTDGVSAMEDALAFALGVNPIEAARGYINLASTLVSAGADVRRARDVHRAGLEFTERFGLGWQASWLRAELALDAYRLGDWQEALDLAERVIADAQRVPHYMAGAALSVRGMIRAARADAEGARADTARSLDMARETGEPQALEPTLAGSAYLLMQLGSIDEARSLLLELERAIEEGEDPVPEPWYMPEYALALRACGADRSAFETARRRAGGSAWFAAAAAYLDGEFERSAELMHGMGMLVHEAAARVAAAEAHLAAGRPADADAQLAAALSFYRSVDATVLISAAERLLPAAS
jgi:tetratricopeptide (TPR) repeat protein